MKRRTSKKLAKTSHVTMTINGPFIDADGNVIEDVNEVLAALERQGIAQVPEPEPEDVLPCECNVSPQVEAAPTLGVFDRVFRFLNGWHMHMQ
jgi:hypothetical protein